jgi:hypothetical protein
MLDISQKGFSVEGSSVQPNDTAPTKGVDINKILPAGMIRNKACLSEEMFIPVATLPEDLSGIPKDADFYKLFSDDHIQHIWHKNMSRVYQSSRVDRHPLWTFLDSRTAWLIRHSKQCRCRGRKVHQEHLESISVCLPVETPTSFVFSG